MANGIFWITGLESKLKKIDSSELPGETEAGFFRVLLQELAHALSRNQVAAVPILDGNGLLARAHDNVSLILADTRIDSVMLSELYKEYAPSCVVFIRRPTLLPKNGIVKFAETESIPFVSLSLPEVDYSPAFEAGESSMGSLPSDLTQFISAEKLKKLEPKVRRIWNFTKPILIDIVKQIIVESACRFFKNLTGMGG